ncbi:MAG: CoA transferase [Rhodospirillaceae bacterium]|nr:CoA transferase [Rhodospirillaceae bacterium]
MVIEDELQAHQPLAGVRVVEIGTSVAAPYAAWILGSLGADVVKVERPGPGDDARQWGRMFPDGQSSYFSALNRDKRGITVDLTDETERAWLREFCVSEVDVVLQNMRPGRVEKYGLGGGELTGSNPQLIYCNLGAFGKVGPLKERPGYDPLMQAYGGIMAITGEDGRPPIRVGTSIVDMGTGLWCAVGVLAALRRRDETGKGCVVDASLYETGVAWMTNSVASAGVDGRNPERQGSGARGMAPYQAYAASDGHLVIAAPNDRLFERLTGVLGHPEWLDDPRFKTNQDRYNNLPELNALIEPIVAEQPRAHWQAELDTVGIPNAPVQQVLEMMADPQTEALGIIQNADGGPNLMGMPLSFNGERPPLSRYAPLLGQHNDEIKGKQD